MGQGETLTVSISGAKYVTASVGSGDGAPHAGCVPGKELAAGSAVTWIPAHKECAGIRGLPVPIYDAYATDEAHAETCNFNMGAPANGVAVGNQYQLPGWFVTA